MSGAVLTHDPSAVNSKNDRMGLQAHVVKDLVIGPLQEGGIDRHYRTKALGGHACCKGHCVLFRNAHVKKPFRECLGKLVESGSFRHGCRYCDNPFIFAGQLDQCLPEDLGIGGRFVTGGDAVSRCDFK